MSNKTLTIRYFASFREHAGIGQETVTLDAITTADVFKALSHRHGSEEPQAHCKVAVNDDMVDWETEIQDGDTVLLFPPVAGG